MKVQVLQVPYDSGHRGLRMGQGPEHFIRCGVEQMLRQDGHDVRLDSIEPESSFRAEIKTAMELCRLLSVRVRRVRAEERFPLVLSGNCNSSVGTLAGLGSEGLGMIWFDAHGDFNTPETKESSFFDGMGMAVATGRCWRKLAMTIPDFKPLSEPNVIHVGGRDFDPEEGELLLQSGIGVVTAERIKKEGMAEAFGAALDRLRGRVRRLYLHVDLDVLDPLDTPANEYALKVEGGLMPEQVLEAIGMIKRSFQICACGIASFDPEYDRNNQTLRAGISIIRSVLS
jgi:arginase